VYGSAGFKTTQTPPEGVERNITGPLLFKWCRVDYNNKKTIDWRFPKKNISAKLCMAVERENPHPKRKVASIMTPL